MSTVVAVTPRTPGEESIYGYLTSIDAIRKRAIPPSDMHYQGLEDFFLRHGRFYDSAPLTAEELAYLKKVLVTYGRRCMPKQCFYNSQMILLTADTWMPKVPGMTLRYVEGYGHGVIPIHHGWLTLNGKVIDSTLRLDALPKRSPLAKRVVGTFPGTTGYFGVPFRTEEVRRSVIERREGGSLLIDLKRKFPFLRRPYEVHDDDAE